MLELVWALESALVTVSAVYSGQCDEAETDSCASLRSGPSVPSCWDYSPDPARARAVRRRAWGHAAKGKKAFQLNPSLRK